MQNMAETHTHTHKIARTSFFYFILFGFIHLYFVDYLLGPQGGEKGKHVHKQQYCSYKEEKMG